MGRKTGTFCESVEKIDGKKFGREELRNINTSRVACGTIQRVGNVPRQLETLDVAHQGKIGIESQCLQGGGRRVEIIQRQASVGANSRLKGVPGLEPQYCKYYSQS